MAKKDALLKIDYIPSKNAGSSTTTFGGGTTSVDTSAFLLRDGTRTMLANLDMGGFSIVNVNLLDGVDLPTLLSSYNAHIIAYNAHIANANAHHNQVHGLLSSDHTVSGLTIGNYLRANSSTTFGFAQIQHSELGGVSANQHHNQIHAITGSDHTVVGSAFDLIGLSTTNTLSVLTPSANVSTGIERILKSSSSGNLNLASLTTILINSAAELTLNPVGNIILDSQSGATVPGGTIQDDLGAYNRKWKTLFVAELYAETLVAQDVISTIGGRIMVAPTTTLIADVSNIATTIDVKHNNLQSGDFVVLQTAPNGAIQFESMRITSAATTISGGFRYSVTRNLDGSNSPNISGNWDTWFAGDAVVDITDGYIDLTSTSTMLNHFGPVVAIYDRTSVGSWAGLTPTVALGNIKGFVDFSTDNFGIAIGNNLTLTPSTGFVGLAADATNGIRLFNTPLKMFNGAIETVHIAGWNDIWIGPNSSDKKLSWDGTTLTITGVVNVVGGNAATIGNITGAANLLRNSSFEVDSDGDGLSDNFIIYNNDGASVPTYAGRVYGEKSTWAQRISWVGTNASTKGICFFAGSRRANVDYTITFWARTNTTTGLLIAHNFPPTSTTNLSWPTANNSWQFYAAKLRWPSNNSDFWYLTIGWSDPITNGWIDFDNIQVIEGSEIMPWSLAPSDKANTSLDNSVISTLINGASIRVGSGTKDVNLNGWNIDNTEIVGQAAGVDQVVLNTSGQILAGAGNIKLSIDGLTAKSSHGVDSTSSTYPIGWTYTYPGSEVLFQDAPDLFDYGLDAVFYPGGKIGDLRSESLHVVPVMFPQSWWTTHFLKLEMPVILPKPPAVPGYSQSTLIAGIKLIAGNNTLTIPHSSSFTTQLPLWNDYPLALLSGTNTWTQNNYFNGNVGIGTTTPAALCDVNGRILAVTVGYDWSELTPQNNWSNYGSPNATFGVKRFGDMISVKGRITAGAAISANTAINSQLAAEYRPSAGRSFACMGSIGGAKAVVRVYVDSSGYIRPQDGFSSGDWLSVEFTYFTGG